ncbi:MAG: redoxin domain-containing protein [Geodermatophilaceae bacterium]
MTQTTTDRRPSAFGSPRRRWAILAGVGVAVLAVLAVVYTVLSPAPGGSGQASADTSFTASTLTGQEVTVPGGKPTVIFFFSATCGSCAAGAQALADAQQTNPEANYVAVDIDPSETADDVREFLTANQAEGLAYATDTNGSISRAYEVTRLSTAVVLDSEGAEVSREVEPTLDQILAALTAAGSR